MISPSSLLEADDPLDQIIVLGRVAKHDHVAAMR